LMDKERRSRLKRVVTEARKVVEADVKTQLRRLGFEESGKTRPIEELNHLSGEDKEVRNKIIGAMKKEKTGGISDREAFDRYVRQVGFTYVNRIAALRTMEVRKLIRETVLRCDVYGGRSLREYEIAEREGIVDPYRLLKTSLVEAFMEVSAEIKVLFDVNSEYSLVFPGHKSLLELIHLLSDEVPKEDWKEDDVIGWIYQYYNEEARAEFKRAKRKPKADDIPVINQFYTPRWVVRVLVDNTLGRLWLEMNRRCPKLGDPIVISKEQLTNPSGDTVDEFCSYLVPLSNEPPSRKRKRVREIRVLDPACGSGHFLIYAFDVLFRMYNEDEPETPLEEIPRLILEHNLHGIDIDLRAVQLAALSLYLKAKSYNPTLKITKMNLVCADARITDGNVRKGFLESFALDPELQKIFAKIFEDLEYTYEVGSLLKAREPFERLFERRREEGVQSVLVSRIQGQTSISRSGNIEGQTKLDMKIVEDKEAVQIIAIPREVTLEQMLNALKEFEREAMEKRDMGTLLFATEAEKSVGLLALLTERYDVVLMNPAYGGARVLPSRIKKYLKKHYRRTRNDYYAAFIEQAIDSVESNGFIGMLTSRTFMFLRSFQTLREDILLNDGVPELLIDTGFGVLDGATVETAVTVLRKIRGLSNISSRNKNCVFCRLTMFDTYEKEKKFMESLCSYLKKHMHAFWYITNLDDFAQIPGTTYAYWASPTLIALFSKYPPLDRDAIKRLEAEKIGDIKQGLATADDMRFIRRFWETYPKTIGESNKWVPFAKGGEHAFYADVNFVINWKNDGEEVKDWITRRYPYLNGKWEWVIKNSDYYFREGLTYPPAATGYNVRILVRYLPKGCIFGHKGCSLFFPSSDFLWATLGILNSELTWFMLLLLTPSRAWEVSQVASLPYPVDSKKNLVSLSIYSQEITSLLRELDTGNEPSTIFVKPWILQLLHGFDFKNKPTTGHPFADDFEWSNWEALKQVRRKTRSKQISITKLAELAIEREQIIDARLKQLQKQIDEEVYHVYEISKEDKELIERELASRLGEGSSFQENKSVKEEQIKATIDWKPRIKKHVTRLISFYIKKTLESDPDAIVPVHQLVQEIRKHLAKDFEDQQDVKEKEIEEILGKNLEEWIATDYFELHVDLYKRRPIFWHLTSCNFARGRTSTGAFNCFINYHKLDRDTIPKIRVNHLRPELDRAKWKVDRLKRELQESREAGDKRKERRLSEELDSALSTLEELQNFQKALEEIHNPRKEKTKLPKNARWVDQKIAEVRDNGYNPVIDYGVRVNIEPLKEAGLLHKAARRVR